MGFERCINLIVLGFTPPFRLDVVAIFGKIIIFGAIGSKLKPVSVKSPWWGHEFRNLSAVLGWVHDA